MEHRVRFWHRGAEVALDLNTGPFGPTTTVLQWLRSQPGTQGTKEGCAEGDCGACTVVLGRADGKGGLRTRAVDSCLIFLPMLDGKVLLTVEDLGPLEDLHPVQRAMVDTDGSQCGYCTPGFVMSLYALYREGGKPSTEKIEDALVGNLCRCTGYRSIVQAAVLACGDLRKDRPFAGEEEAVAWAAGFETIDLRIEREDQRYDRPASLDGAWSVLEERPKTQPFCGATDLALKVTKEGARLPALLDLGALAELQQIEDLGQALAIGAGVDLERLSRVATSRFEALRAMLDLFGSKQIRELATIGGNLCSASPIGDLPPVLMAYDARVVIGSASGEREMDLEDFITGYRTTALGPGELLLRIILPDPVEGVEVRAFKSSKRKDLDISTVSMAIRLEREGETVTDVRMIYGGMAAMTKRAANAEQLLIGKPWIRESVEAAMAAVDSDFEPISDARASAEGRRVLARNLLLKCWSEWELPAESPST